MRLPEILEAMRAGGFRDLHGSRVETILAIGEPLLNALLSTSLPPHAPVRQLSVHPQAGDRLAVRVKLSRPEFLPPINATIAIERQPELPHDPTLRLRITGLAGVLAMAGPLLSLAPKLPPGVRLAADLLTVDLQGVLAEHGYADLLRLARRFAVHSEEGRLVLQIEAAVT